MTFKNSKSLCWCKILGTHTSHRIIWLDEKVPRRVILFAPEGVDTSNWAGHRCTFCTLQRWKTDIEQDSSSKQMLHLLQAHNEDSHTPSERSGERAWTKLWWTKKSPVSWEHTLEAWKWWKILIVRYSTDGFCFWALNPAQLLMENTPG